MADRILVVDDEEIIRDSLSFILQKEGYSVTSASNGKEAYQKILDQPFDVVITDIEMPEMRGIDLLDKVIRTNPQTMVVMITAYGSMETAIEALRRGASDYILKPIEFDELLVKLNRLVEQKHMRTENQLLRRELNREYDFEHIVGESPAMQRIFDTIKSVAQANSTVLITGRSGTGKELVARAIHFNSPRGTRPFVAVNCGAIPETLIESELFGHKRGSFTGATADREGYFRAADKGTLFLDEISEMPLQLQVRLLRAIEQREIAPVGTSQPIAVDVRFLASTNRDLRKEVESGRFREDLYYRLNVIEIRLPSLVERREDIPLLIDSFLRKYRLEMRKDIRGVSNEAMRLLVQHEWKGEIRELQNVIERAVIFCNGDYVLPEDLPGMTSHSSGFEQPPESKSLDDALRDLERQYIAGVLRKNNLDKELTARDLNISLPTLYRRIKDLRIHADDR